MQWTELCIRDIVLPPPCSGILLWSAPHHSPPPSHNIFFPSENCSSPILYGSTWAANYSALLSRQQWWVTHAQPIRALNCPAAVIGLGMTTWSKLGQSHSFPKSFTWMLRERVFPESLPVWIDTSLWFPVDTSSSSFHLSVEEIKAEGLKRRAEGVLSQHEWCLYSPRG